MKIPQTPKNFRKIINENPQTVFDLLENKEVIDFVAECNQKYLHWDELRHRKIPKDVKPDIVWALMKIFRQNRLNKLNFGGEVFNYSLLDETSRKLHVLDKSCAGHLETDFDSINLEGREKYVISSLMEEAIASSQLEGAVTTRKIAKELLRANKKPRDYSEKMIVNGYLTMQKIIKMVHDRENKINQQTILELQENITRDTLKNKEDEGKFRDTNDVFLGSDSHPGEIYHQPPDYKRVPILINELCEFANNDNGKFIHPIVKGIILHFLIGYIHPFNDGNGRTARAIFYWYVLTRGYWLFEYMPVSRILVRSRTNYALSYLFTETDDKDLTYFIKYNLSSIEDALNEMNKYIARKQREQVEAMKLIQTLKDLNMRQADILKRFMKNPDKAFAITEIMNTYGVVYQTARSDLLHLAKLGHISKFSHKNKFLFRLSKNR